MEAGLQVIMIFIPIRCLEALIWSLLYVEYGIYVCYRHVNNILYTLVTEVYNQKVFLLIQVQ